MEKLSAQDPRGVGAYRLLARLGSGGLGRVYLARSEGGSTVAVRVVRRELAGQPAFRASLREAVAAARRVTGAWTVPVVDADTEAEVPWVVSDYVAAPTLLSLVSLVPGGGTGHGPLPARSVRVLASGLAHALEDVHGAGLVHRDFKPSNVFITEHGPLVRDFGIARTLDAATDGGLRLTGTLIGAPGFMSPEQVRGEAATPASDVFSLGSVLTYAATGRLPFGGTDSSAHALQLRITQEEPDTSGLPEGLGRLVRDCLRKDPALRPSARAILSRVGGPETAGEPWLPADVLAELAQHTARLSPAAPKPPADPGFVGPLPPQQETPQQQQQQQQQAYIYPLRHHDYHQPLPHQQPPPPPSFADVYADAPAHSPSPDGDEPPARSKRATIALIAVAVVVAIGAGGAVYSVMGSGSPKTGATASSAPGATSRASALTPPSPNVSTASSSTSASASPSPSVKGDVPQRFVGTWNGRVRTRDGYSPRRLVIKQGKVGDTVLVLTADGAAKGKRGYHCEFTAPLAARPSGATGSPLRIGPSSVKVGRPKSSCTPGAPTTLTIRPDGSLRRATADGNSLTYKRG